MFMLPFMANKDVYIACDWWSGRVVDDIELDAEVSASFSRGPCFRHH